MSKLCTTSIRRQARKNVPPFLTCEKIQDKRFANVRRNKTSAALLGSWPGRLLALKSKTVTTIYRRSCAMPISQKLQEYLDQQQVKYQVVTHSLAYTVQE